MEVPHLAGIVNPLRGLICRQSKVGISPSHPPPAPLKRLPQTPLVPPHQVRYNAIDTEVIRLPHQLGDGIGVAAAAKM